MSDEQLTELGNKMGHLLTMQRAYRWIADEDDDDSSIESE